MKDLSAQLSGKEADLAAALVEKRSLMNDLCELKDEAVSVRLVPAILDLLFLKLLPVSLPPSLPPASY